MSRISHFDLNRMMTDVISAHCTQPKKPSNAFREVDGWTPYAVHPIWQGLLILHEEHLDEEIRIRGCKALFAHDILEDTDAELPDWANTDDVRPLVEGMTFTKDQVSSVEIWKRGKNVIFLKFYDVVANLLTEGKFTPEKKQKRREHAVDMLHWVEARYGKCLNITNMARGILQKP